MEHTTRPVADDDALSIRHGDEATFHPPCTHRALVGLVAMSMEKERAGSNDVGRRSRLQHRCPPQPLPPGSRSVYGLVSGASRPSRLPTPAAQWHRRLGFTHLPLRGQRRSGPGGASPTSRFTQGSVDQWTPGTSCSVPWDPHHGQRRSLGTSLCAHTARHCPHAGCFGS